MDSDANMIIEENLDIESFAKLKEAELSIQLEELGIGIISKRS